MANPFADNSNPFVDNSNPFADNSAKKQTNPFADNSSSSNPFEDNNSAAQKTNPFMDNSTNTPSKPSNTNPFGDDSKSTNPFVDDSKSSGTNPFGDDSKSNKSSGTNPFGDDSKSSSTNPFGGDSKQTNPFGDDSKTSKPSGTNPFGDDFKQTNPFGDDSKSSSTNPFGDDSKPTKSSNTNPFGDDSKSTKSSGTNPFGDDSKSNKSSGTNPFGDDSNVQTKSDTIGTKHTISKQNQSSETNPFSTSSPKEDVSNPFASPRRPQSTNNSQQIESNPFTEESKLSSSQKSASSSQNKSNPFEVDDLTKSQPFSTHTPTTSTPNPFEDTTNPFGSHSSTTNPFGSHSPINKPKEEERAPQIMKKSTKIIGGNQPTDKPLKKSTEIKRKTQAQTTRIMESDDIEESWLDKNTQDISNRGITVKSIVSANTRVLIIGKEKHYFFKDFVFNLIRNIPSHITKAALDPTGSHLLLSTFDGNLLYLSKDLIEAIPIKIPQPTDGTTYYVITAMRFDYNNTDKSSTNNHLRIMLATSNRTILMLTIDTTTSPIKTTCDILYFNQRKTTASTSPFNSIDWIDTTTHTIILASSPSCLQKIVVSKEHRIEKDESVLEMPLHTQSDTGSFTLTRDNEDSNRYQALWVSGKMKGINPSNPAESSNIVSHLSYDVIGNDIRQISKSDSIRNVVIACQTQNHIFYLYSDHLICCSLLTGRSCIQQIEGNAVTMSADQSADEETVFVSTSFCLYKFTVPFGFMKDDIVFSRKLLRDIGDDTKLYRCLFTRLGEECEKEDKKISCAVLYCWCVALLLERLNVTENTKHLFSQMKALFCKEFDGVDKINTQIVRYMVRSCGCEEAFLLYCDCTRDYEGKTAWMMEKSMYSEAFKYLRSLTMSKKSSTIGEDLVKMYFSILWTHLPEEFMEFLYTRDTSEFTALYTTLLTHKNQAFSLKFAVELLQKKESGKAFNVDKALVEFIFWKYVDPSSTVSDENVLSFLESKDHWKYLQFETSLRALKAKEFNRSCLFMDIQKQRYECAIDDAITLIRTYDYYNKDSQYEQDVTLLLTLPSKLKDEEERKFQYLKAMNGYLSLMKLSHDQEQIKRQMIYDTIQKTNLPIEDLLLLLPPDWELGEFKTLIKAAVSSQDKKKQKDLIMKLKQHVVQVLKHLRLELHSLRCSYCNNTIIPSKRAPLDQTRGVMFPCSHCFHTLCIKKEFSKHPTDFARSVTQSIMFAGDEEEQFACYAAECPICGEHSVNLIDFPYTSAQEDEYWKL
ncbi:Pep3/Vps18/deep orange beta-propeller domain-containing protein [Entamoeba marina]